MEKSELEEKVVEKTREVFALRLDEVEEEELKL